MAAFALVLRASLPDGSPVPVSPHPYTELRPPWVIAHRGGMGRWPENTLFAFERALAAGADVLEMDLQSSRDDVLMVIHDATVDRVTDGTGAVREFTRAELQAFDAAQHFVDASGKRSLRGNGIRIPTLEEVVAGFPDARISVELKPEAPALVARLCSLIRSQGADDRMMVSSFFAEVLIAFRRACPEVATSLSVAEAAVFYARARLGFPSAEPPPAEVLIVPVSVLGFDGVAPSVLRAAGRLGLRTLVFTANSEAQMRALLEAGADGILTDDPALLRSVIDSIHAP